ncbi:MAG: sensor histidine kinase [Flavobacterium sp.]|nr:sensor histidine kinase [Pedobacter sp.]
MKKKFKNLLILVLVTGFQITGSGQSIPQKLSKLLASLSEAKSDDEKAFLYNKISQNYQDIDSVKAWSYQKAAFQIYTKSKSKKGLAKNHNVKAGIFLSQNLPDSSIKYYEKGRKLAVQCKDRFIEVESLLGLGLIERRNSRLITAQKYYRESLEIAESANDTLGQALSLRQIGNMYLVSQDFDKAKEYYRQAYKLFVSLKNLPRISECLGSLGYIERNSGNYKSAITYYQKAAKLFELTGDMSMKAIVFAEIGKAQIESGQSKESIPNFLKSLQTYKSSQNNQHIDAIYVYLGQAYTNIAQFDKAEKSLLKGYHMAVAEPDIETQRDALQSIYDFHKKTNRSYSALIYLEKLNAVKDSIADRQHLTSIRDLQTKYATERKEKELAKSKETLMLNAMELSRKNSWLIYSAFFVLLLSSFAFIIYRTWRIKHSKLKTKNEFSLKLAGAEARFQLQEEKLRISRELHDNIGSQLTFINTSIQHLNKLASVDTGVLVEIQKITQVAITELRRTVWLINKQEVDLDEFIIKLREYVKPFQAANQNLIICISSNGCCVLNALAATNLFRIIQEGVNNIIKYAQANKLDITVFCEQGKVVLTLTDNGIGFDLEAVKEGFGLKNIKARAVALEGDCAIESSLGNGTKVSVYFPV